MLVKLRSSRQQQENEMESLYIASGMMNYPKGFNINTIFKAVPMFYNCNRRSKGKKDTFPDAKGEEK